MKAVCGMGENGRKKKICSFSVTYKSLFTLFPQMWINENKKERGEILWGNYRPFFRITL
jgi:hypothetical protein